MTVKITQRTLYENLTPSGKNPPRTVLERIALTINAVPRDVYTISEVGCGNGLLINGLRDAGYDPVACDISMNALRQIQRGRRVQADAESLPFTTESFDLVFACELLEHIPALFFDKVLSEISRVSQKYIVITTPYQEKLEWNNARCNTCGCIFNGAYHLRSFNDNDLKSLFKGFKCKSLKGIVPVLHPDRTMAIELFIRHQLALEYRYYSPSVHCPLCSAPVARRPDRNWIGWLAAGIRYFYRIINRKKTPLWYLAVFEKP